MRQDQKIVILLATFNGAQHIREQLASFVSQSYQNWELVVSDDGSRDGTPEIVAEFGRTVPQKVSVLKGPKLGFWMNFLSLVKQTDDTKGDLFAFSDQDDIWLPGKLERAAQWFADRAPGSPALYFTRTDLIREDGTPLGLSPLFRRAPSFQNALVQNIGGGNTMVMNRSAKRLLAQTPGGVSLISHDWWTYQLVTGAGGLAFYDPVPSLKYRQHRRNLVGSNKGLRQGFIRATAFLNRRMKQWNNVNLTALNRMRPLFLQQNLRTLDSFLMAREAGLPKRIYFLWRSGIYRQSVLQTIGIYLGAFFNLI